MERTVMFRTFEESDAESIYKWLNDDSLMSMSVGLNRRLSHEEVDNWIKARKNHNPYQVFWAICPIGQPDRIIGYACMTDIHYINSSANFSGVVIGDGDYRDGLAWVETFLFVYEYAFERLNLNRLYGSAIVGHRLSNLMAEATYQKQDGVFREAIYKNGRFYDLAYYSILRTEYFKHKEAGDFSIMKLIRHISKLTKLYK